MKNNIIPIMIQSIRQYKNNDELINDLENNKNLVFVNPKAKEIFKSYFEVQTLVCVLLKVIQPYISLRK